MAVRKRRVFGQLSLLREIEGGYYVQADVRFCRGGDCCLGAFGRVWANRCPNCRSGRDSGGHRGSGCGSYRSSD
jgi:hypothetical protein